MQSEDLKILKIYCLEALQNTLPERSWAVICHAILENSKEAFLQSSMGFDCQGLHGQVRLGFSRSFLLATCPGISEAGALSDLFIQDWASEISNLFLGRLKGKLLSHQIFLELQPPQVVLQGKSDEQIFSGSWEEIDLYLQDGTDSLAMNLRLQVDENFKLTEFPIQNPDNLQPGDAVYQLNESPLHRRRYDMIYKVRSGETLEGEEDTNALFDEDRPASVHVYVPSGPVESKSSADDADQSAYVTPLHSSQMTKTTNATQRVLQAIHWGEDGRLILGFTHQLEYSLSLDHLLVQNGTAVFVVEGYRLEIKREGVSLRVDLPELQLSLVKASLPT